MTIELITIPIGEGTYDEDVKSFLSTIDKKKVCNDCEKKVGEWRIYFSERYWGNFGKVDESCCNECLTNALTGYHSGGGIIPDAIWRIERVRFVDIITKKGKKHEIERKWLVKKGDAFKELEGGTMDVFQFYTEITDDKEVRYRQIMYGKDDSIYNKTMKIGRGFDRIEGEDDIEEEDYDEAKESKVPDTIIIHKVRKRVWIDATMYEIDSCITPSLPENMVIVEVEFETTKEALEFKFPTDVVPRYFKDPNEVTIDEKYKNKNIARNKRIG